MSEKVQQETIFKIADTFSGMLLEVSHRLRIAVVLWLIWKLDLRDDVQFILDRWPQSNESNLRLN